MEPPSAPVSATLSKKSSRGALLALIAVVAMAMGLRAGRLLDRHANQVKPPTKVLPLTTGTGIERNGSFSPDGSQIVYEWEPEGGKRHLYIKVVGSGDPIQLTSGEVVEHGPAWSPDGRLIAFLRQFDDSKSAVFVVPPLGGVERKIVDTVSPPRKISETVR